MKRILGCLSILFVLYRPAPAQTATFDITFTGFTPEAETAFNNAAAIWSNILVSAIPIKISAHFQPLLPGTLGITFPNGALNFTGAPVPNVWYATCLANAITGTELNVGFADMELYINNSIDWYYGDDGLCPLGKYDLESVILHEICHGLGFVSLANKSGMKGSFGIIDASAFFPLTTSFPWPALDTLPSVFDHYLVNGDGTNLTTLVNPGDELGTDFTGNDIYLNGPQAVAANGGVQPKIYAPLTFTLGSSVSHLNEGTYPVGNPNELMTPSANPGTSNHVPGPIVLGALKDIGWEIVEPLGINSPSAAQNVSVYPNPVSSLLTIYCISNTNEKTEMRITDITGKVVTVKSFDLSKGINTLQMDLRNLVAGIYFVRLNQEEKEIIKL